MSKVAGFFKGLVWGGLVGSALVILLTPYTGEDLKARVLGYIENVQQEVKQAGVEKREELESQLARLRAGEY
ncbi:MAG: YtxH domain-containing protein [Anaerolineaceae bacterium]|nr:YtxH domain-containing protein [Anaerolineaceae bacterium]